MPRLQHMQAVNAGALAVGLSRFDVALLIAFIAAKETNYGRRQNGWIPLRYGADRADQCTDARSNQSGSKSKSTAHNIGLCPSLPAKTICELSNMFADGGIQHRQVPCEIPADAVPEP